MVLLGDAEHLAEDLDRQRVGEVGDEVELDRLAGAVLGDERVDPRLHPLLDELAQPVDLAGPERLGHQLAEPGVVGVVEQHQRAPARWPLSRRSISAMVSGVGSALSISDETVGSRSMALTSA